MRRINVSFRAALGMMALLLPAAVGTQAGPQPANTTSPGELIADRPTLHCLAFRWLISGDDNGNATVTVSYREQGAKTWRPALPLLRVNREIVDRDFTPYQAGNLFAGSLLNLKPDTAYEARFQLFDPDGGGMEKTLTARTRAVPPVYKGERQRDVYPPGYTGARRPDFPDLAAAIKAARPGDVIRLHAGTYTGPFTFAASGTKERPIVFRPAGDGEVRLVCPDATAPLCEVAAGTHYLIFENLTLRGGRVGIKANGCHGLIVRRCRITTGEAGIISNTPDAEDWYIADNVITGRVVNWYPRKDGDGAGINLPGVGNIACHNRVSGFWDGISTDNHGPMKAEWATMRFPPQMALDIYNNDCSEMVDDGIEADHALHNIRVWNNRVRNVHVGLSSQPHGGGPLYYIGNLVYNTTYTPFKMHNYTTGLRVFHNTTVSARQALESWPPRWQNTTFRNNLFLGAGRYTVETGSPDKRVTLDYNGYGRREDGQPMISWSSDGGKTWGRYGSLAEFRQATGYEAHGFLIDYTLFVKAAPPKEGQTYLPDAIDLRLRPGSAAIDAGVRLPTVNDGFAGRAPDAGAFEFGKPLPRYGPR